MGSKYVLYVGGSAVTVIGFLSVTLLIPMCYRLFYRLHGGFFLQNRAKIP